MLWQLGKAAKGFWVWDPAAPSALSDAHTSRPRPQPKVAASSLRADQEGLDRFIAGGPPAGESSRAATILQPTGPTDDLIDTLFCSGHSFDADGDLILAGGDRNAQCDLIEPNWSYVFQPDNLNWTRQADLLDEGPVNRVGYGHYYPSTVALHNGQVASIGGGSAPWNAAACGSQPVGYQQLRQNEWQVFDKVSGAWFGQSNGAALPGGVTTDFGFDFYPLVHLLSSGHIFASVVRHGRPGQSPSAFLDVNVTPFPPTGPWTMKPSNSWIKVGASPGTTANLYYPTGFLWPWTVGDAIGSDRVVVIGGWDTNANASYSGFQGSGTGSPALSTVWHIQSPTQSTSAWAPPLGYGAMAYPRVYANATILPNMTVLVIGGSQNEFKPYGDPQHQTKSQVRGIPAYAPELLDLMNPGAGWAVQPAHVSPRLYHAVSVPLKDGRVLVMGGYRSQLSGPLATGWPHSDAELYSPPYISDDFQRPSINLISDPTLVYGDSEFEVQLSGVSGLDIEFATLIRCGSVTHHFDWDQRRVRLNVLQAEEDFVVLTGLPSVANRGPFIAPPGWYLLHVVTTPQGPQGVRVPSVGRFIKVE